MRQAGLPLSAPTTLPTTTLLHGDCLQFMPTLPPQSVQMVFSDLPYQATDAAWDVLLNLDAFWSAARASAASHCQFVFTANLRLAASLLRSNPSQYRYDMVWHKRRPTGSLNAKKAPLRAHEILLVFGASQDACYYPSMTAGKSYCVTTKSRNSDLYAKRDYVADNSHKGATRYPRSVLSFDEADLRNDTLNGRIKTRVHPTQKPVALLDWLIRTYTNEGDTVLDPTAGSGTTAVAALRTGRHCIAIEKDKGFYDTMCSRVAAERERLSSGVVA